MPQRPPTQGGSGVSQDAPDEQAVLWALFAAIAMNGRMRQPASAEFISRDAALVADGMLREFNSRFPQGVAPR